MGRPFLIASALCLVLWSCDDDAASKGGPVAQVREFPFDQELGTARAVAWSVSPFGASCWALSIDDGYFVTRGPDVEKHRSGPAAAPPVWKVTVPQFGAYAFDGGCAPISRSADGGVVIGGQLVPGEAGVEHPYALGVARINADGTIRWSQQVPNVEYASTAGRVAVVALSDGGAALSFTTHPGGGSITEGERVVVFLDGAGKERARTDPARARRAAGAGCARCDQRRRRRRHRRIPAHARKRIQQQRPDRAIRQAGRARLGDPHR